MKWVKVFLGRLFGLDRIDEIQKRLDNMNKQLDNYLRNRSCDILAEDLDTQKKDFSHKRINNDKWQKLLVKHKKQISMLNEQNHKWLVPKIVVDMEKLVLFYSSFACQRCNNKNNLTFHHLIRRDTKSFVDFCRYLCIRYYWANLLVLCTKCHVEVEGRHNSVAKKMLSIPPSKIDAVKKYFELGRRKRQS